MAINKGNTITHLYSGRIGNLILQKNNIARSLPVKRTVPLSKLQELHCNRFEIAMLYGRELKDNETFRSFLFRRSRRKKWLPPYQTAIHDFLGSHFVKSQLFATLLDIGGEAEFEVRGKDYCVTVRLFLPSNSLPVSFRKVSVPGIEVTRIEATGKV